MPILRDSEDIYDDEREALALELSLLRLETYPDKKAFEGWIVYSLTLFEGTKKLVQREGTIHKDDVKFIEGLLGRPKNDPEEYMPIEPDFTFNLQSIGEGDWKLTCMVNYGEVKHKYYGESAIGLSLRISESDAQRFAEELHEQRDRIMETISKN
jgi:hypothetical protein